MLSITKVSDLNISDVFVSEVKKNKAGGEAVYLKLNDDNIILQTDTLNVVNNQDKILEFECQSTKFVDVINDLEELAENTFGSEEINLRPSISEDNILKLGINDQTRMFDSKRKFIDNLEIESKVQILIQPAGIWSKNQECGLSFKLLQVKVLEKEEILQEYSFVDDENEFYDIVPNDF
jgi:hypothetical protein